MRKVLSLITVLLLISSIGFSEIREDIVSNKELTPLGTIKDIGAAIDVAGYNSIGISIKTEGQASTGFTFRVYGRSGPGESNGKLLSATAGVFSEVDYLYDTETA